MLQKRRHRARARQLQEDRVRIASDKAGQGLAGTAPATEPPLEVSLALRRSRRRRRWITLGVVAVLLAIINVYAAYEVSSENNANGGPLLRPSGIPGNLSTSLANLMQLTPIPGVRAPGFTLTDQSGHTLSLASLRGKVVVLEFMDPHCTDICPIVSQEFVDAYHELGGHASKVVFAAINVNQYHATVADMAAYSAQHQLSAIPGWHFFTGPVPTLQATWHAYNIQVQAPNPNADIVHTSAVYFIDAKGTERFLATPMVDRTASGTSYLPPAQIAAWAGGIARLARDMAR
jgi:cytochrome oxidase Cu insertion factor (SCO1/SenC/PrrC family)